MNLSSNNAQDKVLDHDIIEAVVQIRREIHRHPELSHQELQTGQRVRATLLDAGINSISPFFDTGLVADIQGSSPGRTVLLRADLDALPIDEQTGLAFTSETPGVMHACGHDAHTAMVLGAALMLQRRRSELRGTVRCVFQPAEETEPLGGREAVREQWLENVAGAIGVHVDPAIDVGDIGIRGGPVNASSDEFTIEVVGESSHGAKPHLGADAIMAAATIVSELQSIASRRTNPLSPVLITIGMIEGGRAPNIIADRVLLKGILRTMDESQQRVCRKLLAEVSENTARAHGAHANIRIVEGEPVLRNDETMAELIANVVRDLYGPEHIVTPSLSLGSDDFAFYAQEAPGIYIRLGTRNEGLGYTYPLHHPKFAIDESALELGATVMFEAAYRFLSAER